MIVVNPDMRYDAQSILEWDIVKKKLKNLILVLRIPVLKLRLYL